MKSCLAVALCLLVLAPAGAAAEDVEIIRPWAPPVIAGDRIAWVEDTKIDGDYWVVVARPDGSGRVATRIVPLDPDYANVSISASARRVTVVADALGPDPEVRTVGGRLWTGRPWKRLSRQRGCGIFLAPALATDDAWGAGCAGRLVTRDLGQPLRVGPSVPAVPRWAIDSDMAGPYLATRLGDRSEIGVFDRRTSTEIYRVAPGPSDALALDEDGSIAFALPDDRVGWASIEHPTVHVLPVRGTKVRIDGGRVAAQISGDHPRDIGPLHIVRFDGSSVASFKKPGGWDFDADRLLRTYVSGPGIFRAWTTRVRR